MTDAWLELLAGIRDPIRHPLWEPPSMFLSFDPGETVGWAAFREGDLFCGGQYKLIVDADGRMEASQTYDIFDEHEPTMVVIENYRVYSARSKQHSWSTLTTPKLIGYMEAICQARNIPYVLQMASSKQFCTTTRLKEWGMYQSGMKHALDAIRHGCYYLLFDGRSK